MLKRVTRLVPRACQLDPGHFLHGGPQAPQSLAARLDDQVPDENPRAGSHPSEDDPAGAGEQREGRHYRIPLQDLPTVFPHGLPRRFSLQVRTFNEACLMVRRPALELLRHLDDTNFAHPAVRYVLYGEKGTGKTLSLCHVVHFCAKRDWLIVHVPDAHLWVKSSRGLLRSAYSRRRFDQPVEAANWLKSFKTANERFLSQIKIQETYMWNKRESTEKGRPLGEVVEQGLTRVKNATDAVGIVLKELKSQSCSGAFRLLVAVDGVNALWGRTTLKREDKSLMAPEELALVHSLRKMVRNDWHGGAVVLALSQTGSLFTPRMACLPQELLGKEGFDALDPFVPILVSNYSPEEFESCIQYYLENSWLQHEKGWFSSFPFTESPRVRALMSSHGSGLHGLSPFFLTSLRPIRRQERWRGWWRLLDGAFLPTISRQPRARGSGWKPSPGRERGLPAPGQTHAPPVPLCGHGWVPSAAHRSLVPGPGTGERSRGRGGPVPG
ncbi:28S ribosomal protein S29, mitochondrial isoform X2 [Enhydra lutris kenyoni]|uniref:Small ribosomal subunit protein mS29 n=1 Tax=Enhydra lutris kenyoni TaxID=391180 RepID=A0A2Y9IKL6_ENHLU|nr:28S ribosomal protein S29, mitochondrial isoform X2 [Enhydra lutris kenyoni]